jgi:hypothetical protein
MAAAALEGRDKLTLITPKTWTTLGLWVEQLVAESTGKEGKGILPVAGESLGSPECHGDDRFFVQLRVKGQRAAVVERKIAALRRRGHPVAVIEVASSLQIGAEFFRWEIATATAGAILGINPFDQPNVQAAKDRTNKIIAEFTATGKMPVGTAATSESGISIYSNTPALQHSSAPMFLSSFLRSVRPCDYIAFLVYAPMSDTLEKPLQQARHALRDKLRVTTTFGYGPRYLHSTGQLHKGGANNGVFIVITAAPKKDVPIPTEKFTFGQLEYAQALGDFAALQDAGRRVIRVHLDKPDAAHIKKLGSWLESGAR